MTQDRKLLYKVFVTLLSENRIMTLATSGEEGPWAAPVLYAWEENRKGISLYFMSRLSTRHVQDLLKDPRVAAAVHPNETRPLRGLQIEGTVELLQGREALHAVRLYLRQFPSVRGHLPLRSVVRAVGEIRFFRLLPKRVFILSEEHFGWGNRHLLDLSTAS